MALTNISRNIALAVDPAVIRTVTDRLATAGIILGNVHSGRERLRCYQATAAVDVPPLAPREVVMDRFNVTPVQLQILKMIADGHTNGSIGRATGRSEMTIKTHTTRLFKRIGATNRTEAVSIGYRIGLLGGDA